MQRFTAASNFTRPSVVRPRPLPQPRGQILWPWPWLVPIDLINILTLVSTAVFHPAWRRLSVPYRRPIAFHQSPVGGFREISSADAAPRAQSERSSLRRADGRYKQADEQRQQQARHHLDEHRVDPEVELGNGRTVQMAAGRCIDRCYGHQVVRHVASILCICRPHQCNTETNDICPCTDVSVSACHS